MLEAGHFDFERLDVFRLALEVAQWVRKARWESGDASLRDQTRRATESVVLNLAEGLGMSGASRRRHFAIALGSASEAAAALLLADLPGTAEQVQKLRRVNIMLRRLP